MGRLAIIMNVASHYREYIYLELDKSFDCEWHFGVDPMWRQMDTTLLKKVITHKIVGHRPYYLKGVLGVAFRKDISSVLMLGETGFISPWIITFVSRLLFPQRRIYYWTHGMYGNESGLKAFLKRLQFRYADIVFTYGNYAKQIMIKTGLDGDKIAVIHNSLSYDRQLALRNSITESDVYFQHFGNKNPVLIFIGRLTPEKKLNLILEALLSLNKKGVYYNLVLVGNGEMMLPLKKEVDATELNKQVWFFGECFDDKINAELLFNAHLCVSPGNVGLTAMHSMMFGCPVISHNTYSRQMPEFEAILEGKTGSFFEEDNVESLAGCIQRWFSRGITRECIREYCFEEIDKNWSPSFQMSVFKEKLSE